AGGALMHFMPRLGWIDPLLSAVIALSIIWSAFCLIRDAVDVLLEAVPATIDLEHVMGAISAIEGVLEVHDCHIWTITSGMVALPAHVVVKEDAKAGSGDALLTEIKRLLSEQYCIAHSTLQVESRRYEHPQHGDRVCEGA